ncbi:hypothetical protein CPB84DRAFT_1884719 [Gymnopilus junonius]|uniref:Uncharacterized protein n=1 Tax=Gymnopilus junonius TaxID=109634 RepID=A0A9P5NBU5_GYMJU|nr:hypothetical protein CPB84DRAFT_1884719 [Gymnopilus junonius]
MTYLTTLLTLQISDMSVGIAQVAAAPIRIIITSTQPTNAVFEKACFGHAVPLPPAVGSWNVVAANGVKVPVCHPCHGRMSCMRQKSAEISDAFRQFFGLPCIQHHPVLIMPVAHPIVHGNGPQPHVESRWEGRTVAFVLGCGISVLLRLFWVLSIVMYCAIRGRRDDEHEYTHITFVEEYEEPPILSLLS